VLQDISLAVKVDKSQVKDLAKQVAAVEKQVGKLNKIKVTLDTTRAIASLKEMEAAAKRLEVLKKNLGKPGGLRMVSNVLNKIAEDTKLVKESFMSATTATERQARALDLLTLQYKRLREEGRSLAQGGAMGAGGGLTGALGFTTGTAGQVKTIIRDLQKLPRTLASSRQEIKELNFLLENAVEGSESFILLSRALDQAQARQASIRQSIERGGAPQLLLPAAGQTTGTFEIVEREKKLAAETAAIRENSLKIEQGITKNRKEQNRSATSTADIDKAANQRRKTRRNIVSGAAIGGAFPLLFGQGPGAALGGALGGGIGGALGGQGGFAGSLIGTIAGQATIDFMINSLAKLSQALRKPSENVESLTQFLSIAGTELDATISTFQGLGLNATAASLAVEELSKRLGAEGFGSVEDVSRTLERFDNTMRDLRLSAALAGEKFSPVLDFLADVLALVGKAGLPQGGTFQTAARIALASGSKSGGGGATGGSQAVTPGSDQLTQIFNARVNLVKEQVALEKDRAALGRVELADRQGQLAVQQLSNQLSEKELEFSNETNKSKKRLLGLEVDILRQRKEQADAARQTAIIEAQRAVARQKLGLFAQQTNILQQINQLAVERQQIQKGELAGIKAAQGNLQSELDNRFQVLAYQEQAALIGVNELHTRKEIQEVYKGLRAQTLIELNNRKQVLAQQEAEYNLGQLQVQQQRELANLQARGQMGLQLSGIQAGTDPSFFGPFGGGAMTEQLMVLEMQTRLGEMQRKAADLQAQAAVPNLAPDIKRGLDQQSQALRDQIAIYQEYQPEIIQATVLQTRFNEALAFTRPVVDSLGASLTAVVDGTQTAQQAFANFLQSIADMLVDVAKQMIAQYIAIGIARMFAGMGGGGGGGTTDISGFSAYNDSTGLTLASFGGGMASGGRVSGGTSYLVGEKGPELFTPGASGTITPNHAMGGGNVVVNVDATGTQVQGDQPNANKLGEALGAAVRAELLRQKRPGGLLA